MPSCNCHGVYSHAPGCDSARPDINPTMTRQELDVLNDAIAVLQRHSYHVEQVALTSVWDIEYANRLRADGLETVMSRCVKCSYPMRDDAIAANDCCGAAASSVVLTEDGSQMYRCNEHEGLIRGDKTGMSSDYIKIKKEISDAASSSS